MRDFVPVRSCWAEGLVFFASFFSPYYSSFPLRHPERKLLESKDLREAILLLLLAVELYASRPHPTRLNASASPEGRGEDPGSLDSARMTQKPKRKSIASRRSFDSSSFRSG